MDLKGNMQVPGKGGGGPQGMLGGRLSQSDLMASVGTPLCQIIHNFIMDHLEGGSRRQNSKVDVHTLSKTL